MLELAEQMKDPDRYRPIKTGLFAFDRGGGIKFGTYVAILGPDKSGKTALTTKLVLSLGARGNCDVIVHALEESKADWVDRGVTFQSQAITRTKILQLELTKENFEEWGRELTPELENTHIWLEDQVWTASEIIKTQVTEIKKIMENNSWTIDQYKQLGRQRIVVIDGVQLLNDFPDESENNKLQRISRMFMQARGQWGLTIVAIFQLNKAGRIYGNESAYKDATLLVQLRKCLGADKQPIAGLAELAVLPNRQSAPYPFMKIMVDGNHSRVANYGSVVLDDDGNVEEEVPYDLDEAFEEEKELDFYE